MGSHERVERWRGGCEVHEGACWMVGEHGLKMQSGA